MSKIQIKVMLHNFHLFESRFFLLTKVAFLCCKYNLSCNLMSVARISTQPQQTFTCSKSTIDTLEKGVKYVQS